MRLSRSLSNFENSEEARYIYREAHGTDRYNSLFGARCGKERNESI